MLVMPMTHECASRRFVFIAAYEFLVMDDSCRSDY